MMHILAKSGTRICCHDVNILWISLSGVVHCCLMYCDFIAEKFMYSEWELHLINLGAISSLVLKLKLKKCPVAICLVYFY